MRPIAGWMGLLLAVSVTACSRDPGVSAAPTPLAPASAAATPPASLIQSAHPSPEPAATPAPTASPSAAPSGTGAASLEALLPNFAGAQYLTKQSMAGQDVLTRAGDPIFSRLLDLVGAVPDDITAVTASGGDVDLLAISVRGVSGAELSAGMLAAFRELDNVEVTELDVAGVGMQRVTLLEEGAGPALLMRVAGDALVMASGEDAGGPLAEQVLATLLEPKLEERLPATLDGHALQRLSMPAVAVGTSGDMCTLVCPGEPHRLAAQLGVPVEDGDLAIAYSEEAEVSIVAFRFPGVATRELIPARQALFSGGRRMQATELTVGGKAVVRYEDEAFGIQGEEEWQYAHDDVLYVVRARPTEGVPPLVEAAVAALP